VEKLISPTWNVALGALLTARIHTYLPVHKLLWPGDNRIYIRFQYRFRMHISIKYIPMFKLYACIFYLKSHRKPPRRRSKTAYIRDNGSAARLCASSYNITYTLVTLFIFIVYLCSWPVARLTVISVVVIII